MSNKKTRGVAKCKEKSLKPDDFTIEFNVNGIATGENAAKFMSWIGVECRKKIPYNKLAKQVGSKLYNEIWEYAKQSWKIPNDHGKKVTLSKAKIIMKNFRCVLRDEYVNKNITPFKDFDYLDKKLWGSFVAYAKSEEFKDISKKATASAKKNVDHAHVGRCGFAGLEAKVPERWNQLVLSYPHLALIEDDRSKLYTISRSVLNRVTNLYEIGPDKQSEGELKGTLQDLYTKEKEMKADGSYSTKDVVTEVIGKGHQHGGRTRLFSDVIGPTKSLCVELKRRKKSEAIVTSVAASPRIHGLNCISSSSYNDVREIEFVQKCELLRPDGQGAPMVVAKGRVHPTPDRILHGRPMIDGFVKVQIDRVEDGCTMMSLLPESCISDEIEHLGDAKGSFVQWPMKSVKMLSTDSSAQHHSVSMPHYSSPQAVEPSHHSMSTHYTPQFEATSFYQQTMQDERHMYERYSYALQNDQGLNDLLADYPLSQSRNESVSACKSTEPVFVNQPIKPVHAYKHAENVLDCQLTKPVAASKTSNDATKIAELLNKASLRPTSIYILAQQVALQTEDAYSMLFTSPTGMYEERLDETVEFEAIMTLCVNGLADVCILHWFTMYLYKAGRQTGLKNTAYFHPRYIENNLVSDDSEFVIDHMRSVISFHKDKQWFMAPHLLGKHWVLILLQHHPTYKTWKGHIFDSLKGIKDPSNYPITKSFEDAVNQKITWGMVDCRQQPKDWECGYCVMMAMYDFVIHNKEHMLLNKLTMVRQRQIDEFVERTLEVFISSFGANKDEEDG